MKKLIYLTIILSFSSCRYFNVSPVNGITTKNLSQKPSTKDMVGIWEIDEYSYDFIRESGYGNRKVELKLKSDGSFEAINFPYLIDVFSEEVSKKFVNAKGKWKISKDLEEERWGLLMKFDDGDLYKGGMITEYDLYLENNKIIIWEFIGDPDSGNRFLFKKE